MERFEVTVLTKRRLRLKAIILLPFPKAMFNVKAEIPRVIDAIAREKNHTQKAHSTLVWFFFSHRGSFGDESVVTHKTIEMALESKKKCLHRQPCSSREGEETLHCKP